jgi:hypothetical protein
MRVRGEEKRHGRERGQKRREEKRKELYGTNSVEQEWVEGKVNKI